MKNEFLRFLGVTVLLTVLGLASTAPCTLAQAQTGPGYALSLDGVKDYVELPDGVWFSGDFTIEMWVMTGIVHSRTPLLEFGNGLARDSIILAAEQGSTYVDLRLSVGDGRISRSVYTTSGPLPINRWAHVAAMVSHNTGYLYVNGVEVRSVNQNVGAPIPVLRTNNYLGGDTQDCIQATIDEVRIWNVARSAADLQADMHRALAGTEPGLVAYWQFNEGAGPTAADATTNHLDGTLVDGPARVPSGVPFRPEAQTLSATDITLSSAVLRGTAIANNASTQVWFQWGTTTNYGYTTGGNYIGTGTSAVEASNAVNGLLPLTTYHFRAVADSLPGTAYGVDASFTTPAKTNAELSRLNLEWPGHGRLALSPLFNPSLTNYTFSADNSLMSIMVVPTSADTDATLQVRINGGAFAPIASRSPSAEWLMNIGANVVEVKVTAQDGTTTKTYTIAVTRAAPIPPPYVSTQPATLITANSATMNGGVNPNGTSTRAWFAFGLDTNCSGSTGVQYDVGSGTNELSISAPLWNLQPSTTYYYRVQARTTAAKRPAPL